MRGRKDEVLVSESEFVVMWMLGPGDSVAISTTFAKLQLGSVK